MSTWTPSDRRRAIQWRNHGRTPEFIASRLGKPVDEVEFVLENARRGPIKATPPRKCLRCRNEFKPKHDRLYLCDYCKGVNANLAPCAYPMGDGSSLAGRRSK